MKYLFLLCFGIIISCSSYENPLEQEAELPEILIYSGTTLSEPVFDLKDIFEKENGCRVHVMYGASGYLKRVLEVNRTGEIFFPGDSVYLESLKRTAVVTKTVHTGQNRLCFFVAEGNPKRLSGSITQLTDPNLKVMLGADNAGSVGRATKDLLNAHGIYSEVALNARSFTADSQGLAAALRERRADIVINWRSVGFLSKNIDLMDPVEIDSEHLRKVDLSMGLLKYSADTACAEKFMDLAASERGHAVFKKYGLAD